MKTWHAVAISGVMVIAGGAWAEDVTITTYYPSPRGVYENLQTKDLQDYDNPIYHVHPSLDSKLGTVTADKIINLGDLEVVGQFTADQTSHLIGAVNADSTVTIGAGITPTTLLIVNGASTFNSPVTDGSDMTVNGTTHLNHNVTIGASAVDALTVNATATFNEIVNFQKQLNLNGSPISLAAAHNVTIGGTLDVTGAVTAHSTLHVIGTSNLDGAVTAGSTLHVIGTSNLDGAVTAGSTLTVAGTTNLNGNVNIGNAASDVITVYGTTEFKENVTLDKKLTINGDLDVLNGNTHLKNLTVDQYVSVLNPEAVRLDNNVHTTGIVTADIKVAAPLFEDKNNPLYFVDPNLASKMHDLTLDGLLTVNNLTVSGNLTVNGTSDFHGHVFNNTGNLTLEGNVDIVAHGATKPQISTNDPSAFCILGFGGANAGAGCIFPGGGKAGALCASGGGGCHLQVYSSTGGTFDADDTGGVNIGDSVVAATTNFNNGTVTFGAIHAVTASVNNGSTLTTNPGSTMNVNGAMNFSGTTTLNAPGGTATAGSTPVLINSGGHPQWATLPAASTPTTKTCITSISFSSSGTCSGTQSTLNLSSGSLCYTTDTCYGP